MQLILSRHGNTFEKSSDAFWVGGTNDLPLVKEGIEQARTCGKTLKEQNIIPDNFYCAPLKRTYEYTSIVIEELGLEIEPTIDERLREIDYGNWAGKSNDEIIETYGKTELNAWQQHSQWPKSGNWLPSEDTIINNIKSFSNDIKKKETNQTVFAVSSNGILRYFLKLIPSEFERLFQEKKLKVKTGNLCSLNHNGQTYKLDFWNRNPTEL